MLAKIQHFLYELGRFCIILGGGLYVAIALSYYFFSLGALRLFVRAVLWPLDAFGLW